MCYHYVYWERTPLFTRLTPFIYCIGNPWNIPPPFVSESLGSLYAHVFPPLLSYTRHLASLDILPSSLKHWLRIRVGERTYTPPITWTSITRKFTFKAEDSALPLCWGFSWRVHSVYVFSVSSARAGIRAIINVLMSREWMWLSVCYHLAPNQ